VSIASLIFRYGTRSAANVGTSPPRVTKGGSWFPQPVGRVLSLASRTKSATFSKTSVPSATGQIASVVRQATKAVGLSGRRYPLAKVPRRLAASPISPDVLHADGRPCSRVLRSYSGGRTASVLASQPHEACRLFEEAISSPTRTVGQRGPFLLGTRSVAFSKTDAPFEGCLRSYYDYWTRFTFVLVRLGDHDGDKSSVPGTRSVD